MERRGSILVLGFGIRVGAVVPQELGDLSLLGDDRDMQGRCPGPLGPGGASSQIGGITSVLTPWSAAMRRTGPTAAAHVPPTMRRSAVRASISTALCAITSGRSGLPGLQMSKGWRRLAPARLRASPGPASAAEPPCGDFCFVWDGTVDALKVMLDGAGAEVIIGPVERTGGRDGGTASGISHYIRDPDDNLLEFIVY